MPQANTGPHWKTYLCVFAIFTLFRFADERFNHNRVDQFVYDHFWLVIFLPMTLLALFLFIRGFYLEYRS